MNWWRDAFQMHRCWFTLSIVVFTKNSIRFNVWGNAIYVKHSQCDFTSVSHECNISCVCAQQSGKNWRLLVAYWFHFGKVNSSYYFFDMIQNENDMLNIVTVSANAEFHWKKLLYQVISLHLYLLQLLLL